MPTKMLGKLVFLSLVATLSILPSSGPASASSPTPGAEDLVSPQIILETQKPPVFPPAAMAARYSGDVMLEITVMPDGTVGKTKVLECSRPKVGFEEAAVDAVKKWRFEPGRRGDVPVEFTLKFRLNFARTGVGPDGRPRVSAGSFSAAASGVSAGTTSTK